jgi:hypothetical protein
MKKFIALAAFVLSAAFANAGDAPKTQAPAAKPEAKVTKTESTVLVARPATLRERRHLVVVEPVKVVETKKTVEVKTVEVKKECCECSTCGTAGGRRLLNGRLRARTVAVVDTACCANCK